MSADSEERLWVESPDTIWCYNEPDFDVPLNKHTVVEHTEQQIVDLMRQRVEYKDTPQRELIMNFIIVNWCYRFRNTEESQRE